ncbi:MAG: helix-turn-helix domain-containing protein, partial [Fimbriimonas ginsengisoli]|nr:helix-turn-helix domain-containing protein [Fimbriimonas ginsengisoli]
MLVCRVLDEGWSLSQACRQFGVTRPTGRKWVQRALSEGILGMRELSRAPKLVPRRTPH